MNHSSAAKSIVLLLLLEQQRGSHAVSGQGPGVGRVGGDCQQLPEGKLVYRQQPDWRFRQARASRSRPPSCRLAAAQTLCPTAGALLGITQPTRKHGRPPDSWATSQGVRQPHKERPLQQMKQAPRISCKYHTSLNHSPNTP